MILIGVRAGVIPMQCYLIFLAIHHLDNVCKQRRLAARIEFAMCALSRSQWQKTVGCRKTRQLTEPEYCEKLSLKYHVE